MFTKFNRIYIKFKLFLYVIRYLCKAVYKCFLQNKNKSHRYAKTRNLSLMTFIFCNLWTCAQKCLCVSKKSLCSNWYRRHLVSGSVTKDTIVRLPLTTAICLPWQRMTTTLYLPWKRTLFMTIPVKVVCDIYVFEITARASKLFNFLFEDTHFSIFFLTIQKIMWFLFS